MRLTAHLKLNTVCLLFFLVCCSFQNLNAQNKPAAEFQVKAAFLYNFTRFIDWPPSAFSSANAPFVIGIIGNDPFGEYIEQLVKREYVNNHPIVVKRYNQVIEITGCHILFINIPATKKTKEILLLARNHSILTVSDDDNFTRLGGIVSFYKEHHKVRFKINISSSKTAQLEISSKLLSLATISGRTPE